MICRCRLLLHHKLPRYIMSCRLCYCDLLFKLWRAWLNLQFASYLSVASLSSFFHSFYLFFPNVYFFFASE
uniref:Uncharacterized protein n=1 Tax=Arundo donax TaxID=35708 RepID=A0A0A9FLP4_ARUDO